MIDVMVVETATFRSGASTVTVPMSGTFLVTFDNPKDPDDPTWPRVRGMRASGPADVLAQARAYAEQFGCRFVGAEFAGTPVPLGYAAISPTGGRNVHRYGQLCQDCDPTYDPMFRTGVPCEAPHGHAACTVANWRSYHRDPTYGRMEPIYDPAD